MVFELSPPLGKSNVWRENLLWSFSGLDGNEPVAGLIADEWGNLYGTTEIGGPNRGGTVFELSMPY